MQPLSMVRMLKRMRPERYERPRPSLRRPEIAGEPVGGAMAHGRVLSLHNAPLVTPFVSMYGVRGFRPGVRVGVRAPRSRLRNIYLRVSTSRFPAGFCVSATHPHRPHAHTPHTRTLDIGIQRGGENGRNDGRGFPNGKFLFGILHISLIL